MSKRLLLIDDDKSFLMPMSSYLEDLGIDFDSTDNPLEAVELFREKRHGLVLADLEMPIAKGNDVLNFIKSEVKLHSLKTTLILITGVEKVPAKLTSGLEDIEIIYKRNFDPNIFKELLKRENFI